jgi:hypothetical protein
MNPISKLPAARRLRFARARVGVAVARRARGTATSASTVGPVARAAGLPYCKRLGCRPRGRVAAAHAASGGKREACDTAGPEACATTRTDSAKNVTFRPEIAQSRLGNGPAGRRKHGDRASRNRGNPSRTCRDLTISSRRTVFMCCKSCTSPGFARSRRLAGRSAKTLRFVPKFAPPHPTRAGVGGGTGSSWLRETAQPSPKVSRFDHLTAENRVFAFHKLQKSDWGALRVSRLVRRGSRVASARPAPFLAPARSPSTIAQRLTP